jgi:hypothetical protein
MTEAWRRAYLAVHQFGGRVRQYFPSALREAWEAARSPAVAAMKARVRASVASLAPDIAAVDAYMADLYHRDAARQEVRQPTLEAATAVILTFRDRHARRAAEAVTAAAGRAA